MQAVAGRPHETINRLSRIDTAILARVNTKFDACHASTGRFKPRRPEGESRGAELGAHVSLKTTIVYDSFILCRNCCRKKLLIIAAATGAAMAAKCGLAIGPGCDRAHGDLTCPW